VSDDSGFAVPTVWVQTIAARMLVSAELLRNYGPDTRTDAEKAEARREYEAKRARVAEDKRRVWAALCEQTGPLAAVLALHQPTDYDHDGTPVDAGADRAECQGCDIDGYDAEYPRFPCTTVAVIATEVGIPFADETLAAW
jgi:hypothetical protein